MDKSINDTPEIWKAIDGTDNIYEISDHGRVRSWNGYKYKGPLPYMLKPNFMARYGAVVIKVNGTRIRKTIHRLVLETFAPTRNKKQHCRHVDGNRMNNKWANLKWGSIQDNADDRAAHGTQTRGEKVFGSKLRNSDVVEIFKSNEKQRILADKHQVSIDSIWKIRSRRTWIHVTNGLTKCNPAVTQPTVDLHKWRNKKMERLVITVDSNLKKKFFATAKTTGQSASFILRKFLTDFTTKETTRGKKRTTTPKTLAS